MHWLDLCLFVLSWPCEIDKTLKYNNQPSARVSASIYHFKYKHIQESTFIELRITVCHQSHYIIICQQSYYALYLLMHFFFLLFLSILQHLTQIWSNDWIFKKNPSWGNKSCTCPFWSFRISLSWHHWYWWHMLCKIVHVYSITVGYHRYLKQVCFDKKQNLFQNIMHTQTHILVILNNIPDLFQKIK